MSEAAPERVAPPSRAGGGGGNVFTNKIGPLPMWAWVGIAAGILVVWRFYSAKNSASSTASTAAQSTAANTVPQFVNQTYTTLTAPSVPAASTGTTTDTSTPGGATGTSTPDGWASLLAASGAPAPPPAASPVAPTPTAPQQIAKVAPTVGSVTGLRTSGAGATNIGLAWNPVSGAQRYQVRVTYQDKVVKTFFTNGTSYNVTGLSPNRTYGLHVVAINGNQWAPETSISQKTT